MILFLDSETTGLTQPSLPADHAAQPHLVQLGMILTTDEGSEVSAVDLIVRPAGYSIPEGAARVHGITTEIAEACGVPILTALSAYVNLRANARTLVAYNADFDRLVMDAAIARSGKTPSHPGPAEWTCCMRECAPIVAIPPTERMRAAGFDKFKPPNLSEAHRHFFGEDFEGAHSAIADARACARVFFEMRRRAALPEEIPFP